MRKKTPTLIQMEAVECGAACLGILLGYWGRFVPLEELRVDCDVSRDGSNALNMIRAGKKYGLLGTGHKFSSEQLYEQEFPCIVLWENNHYIVIEGVNKTQVFVNDPAVGPKTLSKEEFEEGYSGIALLFVQSETFEAKGAPPKLTQELYARLRSVFPALLYLILVGTCLVVPGLSIAAFARIFIDDFLVSSDYSAASLFLFSLLSILLLAAVLTYLQKYCLMRLNGRLSIEFSAKFLWHLLRLPLMFYMQRYSGEIAYRTHLNNVVSGQITGPIATTAIDIFLILFYGVVLLLYDWMIGLIGFATVALSLSVFWWIQRSRSDAYARVQQEMGKWVGTSLGALQNIETIKATGIEPDMFSRYAGYYAKNQNAFQEIGKKDALLATTPVLMQSLGLAAVIGLGSMHIIEGRLSLGKIIALQTLMVSFLLPIARFVNFGQMMQTIKITFNRLNDTLRGKIDPIYTARAARKGSQLHSKLKGLLEFRDVTFGYNRLSPPLLDNVSFTIQPGGTLAFVGPSGCGKSTIAKLAVGLFRPWAGQILYDGKPLDDLSVEEFTHSIAHVDQEIFLFSGTVRENLSLWNGAVTDEMLMHAAKDAEIHDEILAREKGYESLLLERGRNLSGGQRQRVEIARALIYNPSLLVVDEATSALDSEIEKRIFDKMRQRGCSMLMIAHRLSTIQDCDEILVMQQGKIVQRGNHALLKSQPGLYQNLVLSEERLNV